MTDAPPTPPPSPRQQGMSTGTKVLIGCGALAVLAVLAVVAVVAIGGFALRRGVESAMGGLEDQEQATETLRELREEHPFDPPEDGVVTGDQVERFLAVTEDAWEDMEPWAQDLERLGEREPSGETPSLGDMVSGARAMGGFARARLELAEALDENDTSLGEYAWVGLNLARALEVAEGTREEPGVPAENVRLAREHREALPAFESGTGRVGPGVVLAVATIWGMTEGATWNALGLDTLQAGVR